MNKAEAIETIDEYESDFDSIQSILDDESLTDSEKVSEISDILSGDDQESESIIIDGEEDD